MRELSDTSAASDVEFVTPRNPAVFDGKDFSKLIHIKWMTTNQLMDACLLILSLIFSSLIAPGPHQQKAHSNFSIIVMASSKLVPALPPPPGHTSNFVNPESLYKWNVLCVTMCLVFTTLVFVPRTYVRLAIKREWILEDCTFSLAVFIANLVDLVQICAVSRGYV